MVVLWAQMERGQPEVPGKASPKEWHFGEDLECAIGLSSQRREG